MKKFITLLLAGISAIAITACGGSSSSGTGDSSIDYSGTYDVTAESTTSYDRYGGICLDAYGQMTIDSSNKISGSIISEWGYTLFLSGDVLSTGSISGAFAKGSENVASYSGHMYASGGNGEWEDKRGCGGTWTAVR